MRKINTQNSSVVEQKKKNIRSGKGKNRTSKNKVIDFI